MIFFPFSLRKQPEPLPWMLEAAADLRARQVDDRFELIPRAKAADPSVYEWRIRCLDCPGKVSFDECSRFLNVNSIVWFIIALQPRARSDFRRLPHSLQESKSSCQCRNSTSAKFAMKHRNSVPAPRYLPDVTREMLCDTIRYGTLRYGR